METNFDNIFIPHERSRILATKGLIHHFNIFFPSSVFYCLVRHLALNNHFYVKNKECFTVHLISQTLENPFKLIPFFDCFFFLFRFYVLALQTSLFELITVFSNITLPILFEVEKSSSFWHVDERQFSLFLFFYIYSIAPNGDTSSPNERIARNWMEISVDC